MLSIENSESERIMSIDYEEKLAAFARRYRAAITDSHSTWRLDMPLAVVGPAGCGKTWIVREFSQRFRIRYFFSFRNLTGDFARKRFSEQYPEVFSDCESWEDFFTCLGRAIGREQACLVFDDCREKIVSGQFLEALRAFLRERPERRILVILISRKKEYLERDCQVFRIPRQSPADLKRSFPKLSDEDRLRLLSISDGEAGYLSLYDSDKSFTDNLSAFLREDSLFFRWSEERVRENFRDPESYSSLLYGMATGKHRLSELADFSGYPLNKCQKYLRTLCSFGLAETVDLPGGDRRSRSGYFLGSGYLGFWCRFLMYSGLEEEFPEAEDMPVEGRSLAGKRASAAERMPAMLEYIDGELVPQVFRRLCLGWLRRHVDLRTGDLPEWDSDRLGDFPFDLVGKKEGGLVLVKIWTDLDQSHGGREFERMVEAAESLGLSIRIPIIFSPSAGSGTPCGRGRRSMTTCI